MSARAEALPLISDEPAKSQPATARAMVEMLQRHYIADERHPAYVFAPEIQAPGVTQRRADLICLGVSTATRGALIGHEVKVTRADVMVELADLTKCDPWMRYCNQWYLVIPHLTLIDGLDIPDTWGILTPPSGRRTRSMTVYRKAPALKPLEQGPALKTLAAWQHWKIRDLRHQATERERRAEQLERANQELRLSAPRQVHSAERDVVAQVIAELGPIYGERIGQWGREVRVDDVVAALKDLGAVYNRRDEALRTVESTRRSLERTQGEIVRVLAKSKEGDDGRPGH